MSNVISNRNQQWGLFGLIGLGVLLAGLLAGSALTANGWSPFGSYGVPIYLSADQRVNQAVNLNTGFSAVAKSVTPAVVTVEISARVRPQQIPFPFSGDPFRDFFNRGFPDQPGQDNKQQPRRRPPGSKLHRLHKCLRSAGDCNQPGSAPA